jgi:hypothetical protein
MALESRLSNAEADLSDALIWKEALKVAAETGERPEDVYHETRDLIEKYRHYEVHLPGGTVDIEPLLRAMAEGEGWDVDLLISEARQALRNMKRRQRQRKK